MTQTNASSIIRNLGFKIADKALDHAKIALHHGSHLIHDAAFDLDDLQTFLRDEAHHDEAESNPEPLDTLRDYVHGNIRHLRDGLSALIEEFSPVVVADEREKDEHAPHPDDVDAFSPVHPNHDHDHGFLYVYRRVEDIEYLNGNKLTDESRQELIHALSEAAENQTEADATVRGEPVPSTTRAKGKIHNGPIGGIILTATTKGNSDVLAGFIINLVTDNQIHPYVKKLSFRI